MENAPQAPNLPGYRNGKFIARIDDRNLFAAERESDGLAVVIEQLSPDYHDAHALAQLHQEYATRKLLQGVAGIPPVIDFFDDDLNPLLILRSHNAVPLRKWVTDRKITTAQALNIAWSLAEILGSLHKKGIIYRAISPAHVHWDEAENQVILHGLRRSTQLVQQAANHWHALSGDLLFMSPEQTGRLPRKVDHRSDFYSLGVLFYWMLTKDLPYASDDPVSVLNEIITAEAPPLRELRPDLPEMLCSIVHRLLEKKPEDRYQTAVGLLADISRCLTEFRATCSIPKFDLGMQDISAEFHLPEKLYGREQQIEQILQDFRAVADGGRRLSLVSGFSGMGKTSLIGELREPVLEAGGILLTGKFEQFDRATPFSAVVSAFSGMVGQILNMTEAERGIWRDRIRERLGVNAGVVVEVIPDLQRLLGACEPVRFLNPAENENRFRNCLRDFIQVFTSADHPLVLFLDDLQWADAGSLELMQDCLTSPAHNHFLVIGAFRDNEVDDTHSLTRVLQEVDKSGTPSTRIELPPLSQEHIRELLADTLRQSTEKLNTLSALVLKKTLGNPFSCSTLIRTLHSGGDIRFDPIQHAWCWDDQEIAGKAVSENVVELLIDRISSLPRRTQQALRHGACIGSTFDIRTLALVCGQTMTEIATALWPAVEAGLLVPDNANHDLLRCVEGTQMQERSYSMINASDTFLHDRVQQAAYEMIGQQERLLNHLQIGRLLVEACEANIPDKNLFSIVNHFNVARTLIYEEQELVQVAELNLRAGKRAMASAAYQSAFEFLSLGVKMLPKNAWQSARSLTIDLHHEAAEAAYLSGNQQAMHSLTGEVLRHSKNTLVNVRSHEIRIDALLANNRMKDAIMEAVPVLRSLGIRLQPDPGKLSVMRHLLHTRMLLLNTKPDSFPDMPEITDQRVSSAMRILSRLISASYIASPNLFPIVVLRQVQLTQKYGLSAESASALVIYGLIVSQATGNYEQAFRYGQAGMRVLDLFKDYEYHARTYFNFFKFIHHWKRPIGDTLDPFLKGYQFGIDHGDFEYGSYCAISYFVTAIYCGKDLQGLVRSMPMYLEAVRNLNQITPHTYMSIWTQYVANLADADIRDPARMQGPWYDEAKQVQEQLASDDRTGLGISAASSMRLAWLFGDYNRACELALEAESYIENVQGLIDEPYLHFHTALARLARYPDADRNERGKLKKLILASHKKMEHWCQFAPFNFLSKLHLIQAELARIENRPRAVDGLYTASRDAAREQGFTSDLAYIAECRGRWLAAEGHHDEADQCIAESCRAYIEWGATNKARHLAAQFNLEDRLKG